MILRFVKNPYIFLNNYFKKSKSSHQTCKNKTPTSNDKIISKAIILREFRASPIIDFPIFLRKIP